MSLTLIAFLLAGVVGCDATPEEPVSESEATLKPAEQGPTRSTISASCTASATAFRKTASTLPPVESLELKKPTTPRS